MKKIFTLLVATLMLFLYVSAQQNIVSKDPIVITGYLIKTTSPVKNFKRDQFTIADIKVRDDEGIIGEKDEIEEMPGLPKYTNRNFTGDAALQKHYPGINNNNTSAQRRVTTNFDGIAYNNAGPADPTIAAGPNHIIQMVNGPSGAMFSIYNKSGLQLVAPTYLDNITGKGGIGDPLVLYDQIADRFVMTEFVNKNETVDQGLSIAISKTNDPTGQWYIYFFSTGTTLPDYPKFSVWSDAYYAKTNDFNSTNNYIGSSVYAFDKNKMLAGNATATLQKFNIGAGYRDFSTNPVQLQGNRLPPAGTGGLIAYLQHSSWTGSITDSIGLLECKVDFISPANSKIINNASLAAVPYQTTVCSASRSQCISQPGSTVMLEALDQRVMNQPIYRNFGNYEGIVFSSTVDKGGNISSLRWYELTKTATNWSIYQQSTYSPDDVHRFIPSICYDANGGIGMAYNAASTNVYPGIRYTGRKQCDSINMMTYAENSLIDGTASNKSSRYGDYNHLVCDPDGVTFWFTGMYNSGINWSTRISSFTLDTCSVGCGNATSLNATAITSTSATLSWVGVPNALNYTVDYKATTSATWINAATAVTVNSVNLSALSSATTYDWRVKINCLVGTSIVAVQFTTLPTCNPATGLSSSNITTTSATVSWANVSGATGYNVDYKSTTSAVWTNAGSTTALTINLSALIPGTIYECRVMTNCVGNSSVYSSVSFTTSQPCDAPTGLTSSNITSSGANVSWLAVSNANNYSVDYKAASSTTWTSATASTTSLSVYLNLLAGTVYDWRVKTNCTGNISVYSIAQVTTLSAISCGTPSSLASSAITTNSATVTWGSVSGASTYSVDYKTSTSTAWINLVNSNTTRSVNITGLSEGKVYNWRVRSVCSAGAGAYATAQFTTLITCNAPTALSSTDITVSEATVSWATVSGAANYSVDYKTSAVTTWTNAITSTTATTYKLTALTASTIYNWRVKTNCSGNASGYSSSQFTTSAPCPDVLEPNNSLTAAAPITTGTDVVAKIASSTDLDFYSFNNSASQNNIKITLTNLPANYDMKLYNPAGTAVATAALTGTANETINYNTTVVGTYKVVVYGYNKVSSTTKCYALKVITGSASFAPEIYGLQLDVQNNFHIYPIPASKNVSIIFAENLKSIGELSVANPSGKTLISKKISVNEGINYYELDVSKLPNGVYFIRIANSAKVRTQKLVIVK